MDSNYAYVHFNKGISETDETVNGRLVQLNYPIYEGTTDIMSVSKYKTYERDFPNRISGKIIKKDHLLEVVNLLYGQLKKEIAQLTELDDETRRKFEHFQHAFEQNGVLKSGSNVDELADKYFNLQQQVRKNQRQNMAKSHRHI